MFINTEIVLQLAGQYTRGLPAASWRRCEPLTPIHTNSAVKLKGSGVNHVKKYFFLYLPTLAKFDAMATTHTPVKSLVADGVDVGTLCSVKELFLHHLHATVFLLHLLAFSETGGILCIAV